MVMEVDISMQETGSCFDPPRSDDIPSESSRSRNQMSDSAQEIASLFDESSPLLTFSSESIKQIPEFGSILYTVFLDRSEFIYVGIGGLAGGNVRSRDPRSRIRQHTQGRRSGDQFCIYIQDFYVIPNLVQTDYTPKKGHLDELVRDFIQSKLTFRFVVFQTEDSDQIVRRLEREIQLGQHFDKQPTINGVGSQR